MERNILWKFLRTFLIVAVISRHYFSTCVGQGTQQDAAPITMPNRAENFPEHPNEVAPKQELTTIADSTTPIPRIRQPFEKNTTTLIRLSNQTMDELEIYLDKYDAQLNLNTLDNLIPILKQIQINLTNLLPRTTSLGHIKFEQEKQVLDKEVSQVESQIEDNRELLDLYKEMRRATKEQLGIVYKSLGAILTTQVYTLSIQRNTDPQQHSELDIERFIDYQLINSRNNTLTIIHGYLKKLSTASNRLTGYSYFLSKFNVTSYYDDEDAIVVQLAREVFTLPEFEKLRESFPPVIALLFTNEPKIMKLNDEGKILTIGSTGSPSIVIGMRSDVKRWKFHPLGDSTFFAIVDTKTNQALGNDGSYLFEMLRFDDTIQFLENYHWKIHTVMGGDGDLYLCFINRGTERIMGSISGLYGDDEGYSAIVYSFYQWKLQIE